MNYAYDMLGGLIIPDNIQEGIGLPYMGSKRRIAPQLLKKMLVVKPNAEYFFDLFGGGGAMSFYAAQLGMKVCYNEFDTGLVNLIKFILDRIKKGERSKYGLLPEDYYDFIGRDEFFELLKTDTVKAKFAAICYSFGNNQNTYMYNKAIENFKRLGYEIVVHKCVNSLNELNKLLNVNIKLSHDEDLHLRRLHFYKEFRLHASLTHQQVRGMRLQNLERLQKLEQLEHLTRLKNLQNIKPLNLEISNKCFLDVNINTPLDKTIIYLDPPYRGKAKYPKDIKYNLVDNFFLNTPYSCFMSEYTAPFKPILTIEKVALLKAVNSAERKMSKENLYYNGK